MIKQPNLIKKCNNNKVLIDVREKQILSYVSNINAEIKRAKIDDEFTDEFANIKEIHKSFSITYSPKKHLLCVQPSLINELNRFIKRYSDLLQKYKKLEDKPLPENCVEEDDEFKLFD